jgi:hypothetical protein
LRAEEPPHAGTVPRIRPRVAVSDHGGDPGLDVEDRARPRSVGDEEARAGHRDGHEDALLLEAIEERAERFALEVRRERHEARLAARRIRGRWRCRAGRSLRGEPREDGEKQHR